MTCSRPPRPCCAGIALAVLLGLAGCAYPAGSYYSYGYGYPYYSAYAAYPYAVYGGAWDVWGWSWPYIGGGVWGGGCCYGGGYYRGGRYGYGGGGHWAGQGYRAGGGGWRR